MLAWTLLLSWGACTTTPPPPPPAPRPAAGARAKARRAKVPAGPPLGVPGPATGELLLTAETPPAGGAPTPPVAATLAALSLTFSDGTTARVELGRVVGTCALQTPRVVGPPGSRVEALWSVDCTDASGPHRVDIVQKDLEILAARTVTTGHGPKPRVFRRVRLASGVVVHRAEPDPGGVPAPVAPAPEVPAPSSLSAPAPSTPPVAPATP